VADAIDLSEVVGRVVHGVEEVVEADVARLRARSLLLSARGRPDTTTLDDDVRATQKNVACGRCQ